MTGAFARKMDRISFVTGPFSPAMVRVRHQTGPLARAKLAAHLTMGTEPRAANAVGHMTDTIGLTTTAIAVMKGTLPGTTRASGAAKDRCAGSKAGNSYSKVTVPDAARRTLSSESDSGHPSRVAQHRPGVVNRFSDARHAWQAATALHGGGISGREQNAAFPRSARRCTCPHAQGTSPCPTTA